MEKEFTEEEICEQLEHYEFEAKELIKDTDRLNHFLLRLERKFKKVPVIGKNLAMIPQLASLVQSFSKKEYTEVPIGTILAILGALLYFVSPLDMIADIFPLIGYLDDLAVINFALNMIGDDLEEYNKWREKNGIRLE